MTAPQLDVGDADDAPRLTPEVWDYLAAHGSEINRALLGEVTRLRNELRSVMRQRDEAKRRLRDRRGGIDD